MTATSNLVVPVVLWGKQAPTHCISSVFFTRDQKTLITGCNDGQICLWDVDESFKTVPRCMLFGHTAPVICLARGDTTTDTTYFISSSENGEMCLWDITDGRCLENIKLPYVHTHIHSYCPIGGTALHLLCNGYYTEILVMEASSLEILFTLTSKVNSDWISAVHFLRPPKRQEDVVVGLSVTGTVKVWTLSGTEAKGSELCEHEFKTIRCLNALVLTCCAYNQRTVLIVCTKYWQIYDAGDFSLLCSVENRRGERWTGGDFVAADRVLVWSDEGKGYLYKLPTKFGDLRISDQLFFFQPKSKFPSYDGCIVESKDFHQRAMDGQQPYLYSTLTIPNCQPLACPPAMAYFLVTRCHFQKLLIRGDSEGCVTMWNISDVPEKDIQAQEEQSLKPTEVSPFQTISLQQSWDAMSPSPPGIMDHLDQPAGSAPQLTASIYLPLQGRLVCGREDGSIVIVPATHTILLQLLHGRHQQFDDWRTHQVLQGHTGKVTGLLYPYHVNSRYDIAHLVSGGVDFSICLWDIYTGTLLHTFCVHAGEVTQLLVPPNDCNPRVLQCICSVASDHSVALLGLKERKCAMLASRHLFPVQVIKWRPLDDFMIVGCTDGTVYVWQMETGHLDRVVHGLVAEEVLSACDEHVVSTSDSLANPAVHFFRGLRHRNLAAIRHAAQRGLHQLAHVQHSAMPEAHEIQKSHAYPLMIQGLRTNPKDPDSHVLFFDIEALIVQLLTEEYSSMSPATLEAQGLINQLEYQKVASVTHSSSPEGTKKFSEFFGSVKHAAEHMGQKLQEQDKHGLIAKVKVSAETVGHKIQAKAESVGFKQVSPDASPRRGSGPSGEKSSTQKPKGLMMVETNLTMEIAQLLLSFLHSWSLNPELDHDCETKLGLLRPLCPISFGILTRGGMMSLFLPTWQRRVPPSQLQGTLLGNLMNTDQHILNTEYVKLDDSLPPEMVKLMERTKIFTSKGHWELSTATTTNHLLSIISIANTLMSMNNASFIPEQERQRKTLRKFLRADTRTRLSEGLEGNKEEMAEAFAAQQAQIKQGWSLLATLHCVLLPERVATAAFKRPQVEMLARRWQDRCLEVREAAQALLLAELRRIGTSGRKALVDSWAPFLPNFPDAVPGGPMSGQTTPIAPEAAAALKTDVQHSQHFAKAADENHELDEDEDDENAPDDSQTRKMSSAIEGRRKQATAVVLLGVIGAEFGQDIEPNRRKNADEQKKKNVQDGFGLTNYSLARHTSKALSYLLMAHPNSRLPLHTPLRRAAIDLIGRGFTVWEPYVDVSKILLGLLELCCESDKLVPSMSYGLPLTPAADSCRTARHSLSLIATARPPAFITTMAKEVARFNTLAQNAQTLNINLNNTVLYRARPEILRVIELLIDKMQTDVADLLIEVMDIILHCLDHNLLKSKGLSETFPSICRFNMVSFCSQTRRISVGARNGSLALHELRASKCQIIPAHATPVTACSFSPDGKYLASYSSGENKLCFWQTATGLFGLGNSQTRCVRTYSTNPLPETVKTNPLRMAKLIWTTNKVVILMLLDGSESRFTV